MATTMHACSLVAMAATKRPQAMPLTPVRRKRWLPVTHRMPRVMPKLRHLLMPVRLPRQPQPAWRIQRRRHLRQRRRTESAARTRVDRMRCCG